MYFKIHKEYYELLDVKSDITEEKIFICKKEFLELKNEFNNCVTSIKKLYIKKEKNYEYERDKLKKDLMNNLDKKLGGFISDIESCL